MPSICIKQILRDEEGKKLGLKSKQKSPISADNDVKMSDAEVDNWSNYLNLQIYMLNFF